MLIYLDLEKLLIFTYMVSLSMLSSAQMFLYWDSSTAMLGVLTTVEEGAAVSVSLPDILLKESHRVTISTAMQHT